MEKKNGLLKLIERVATSGLSLLHFILLYVLYIYMLYMFTLYVVTLYITYNYRQYYILGFPGGSDGKESVWNAGYLGRSLGQEDPLEK